MAASMPMYYPNDFSLPTALVCAQLVEIAYDQYTQWQNQKYPYMDKFAWKPGTSSYGFSAPLYWTYDAGFYQEPIGFLATAGSVAYLTFRGTVSSQDQGYDAMIAQTAYTFAPDFGNVHYGFNSIYSQLSPLVLAAIAAANDVTPLTQLIFTGHSLGCALSSLAVPDVVANANLGAQVAMLHINMASPRVGDPVFAAAMNAGPVPTFRVVNTEDIVPDSPLPVGPASLFYEHFGTPVDFTANYLAVDANHSLLGAYTYALSNPTAPQNTEVARAARKGLRAPGPGPGRTDAHVGPAAIAAAAGIAAPSVSTTDAAGRVK